MTSIIHSAKLDLSKPALHQRFNQESVQFLTTQLERVLAITVQAGKHLNILRAFNRVLVFDSTGWNIHKGLKKEFKGSGGSGSPSGCKIQCGFDLKSSTFSHLDITAGNVPDQKYVKIIPSTIKPKDLFLADLGYFCLRTLAIIAQMKAYFLLRYLHGTNVYLKNKAKEVQKVDLLKLLKNKSNSFELNVLLGSDALLPSRLVFIKLSEAQLNQKMRHLNKKADKKMRKLSKAKRLLARWEIFVTNVPLHLLSAPNVARLYRLRWTIELVFKQFKSTLAIHNWNHANPFRLKCEILGTLIVAAIIFSFHQAAQSFSLLVLYKEISIEKLFKLFKNSSSSLFLAIKLSLPKLTLSFLDTFSSILACCLKESRTSRPSSLHHFLKNYGS